LMANEWSSERVVSAGRREAGPEPNCDEREKFD